KMRAKLMKVLPHIVSLALLLAGLAGCDRSGDDAGAVAAGTATPTDGVTIAYDVRGEGETALVFIHGWACDRSFWYEQLADFARDYKVVALDLGGHGESTVDRDVWSTAALGGDVQAVVEELNLEKVVLIGHSLGGAVALEAARLMPGRVVGIVGADTLHNAEQEYTEEMVQQAVAAFEANFQETMSTFVRSAFTDEADPELIDWVVSKACSANGEVASAIILETPKLDLEQSFRAAKVPIRCINAAPYPPRNTETKTETNRKYADFDVVVMEGVGHFLMLEQPADFNTHLRDILAELLSR
ncbi:MAG: alpha/beta hydrolase, partial [Phycisphaerales bacterium]